MTESRKDNTRQTEHNIRQDSNHDSCLSLLRSYCTTQQEDNIRQDYIRQDKTRKHKRRQDNAQHTQQDKEKEDPFKKSNPILTNWSHENKIKRLGKGKGSSRRKLKHSSPSAYFYQHPCTMVHVHDNDDDDAWAMMHGCILAAGCICMLHADAAWVHACIYCVRA